MEMKDMDNKTDTPDGTGKFHLPPSAYHRIFWPIVILGITADLWTKFAVFEWLSSLPCTCEQYALILERCPCKQYTFIEGWFDFVMRLNNGAAFSIASGQRVILVAVSVIAMFVVVGIFLFGKIDKKIMVVILALFLAGIVGNLYDRAMTGLVRDFIDVHYREVYHWPAFNIADSMLCTAVGLMIIIQIRAAISEKRSHRQK